MTQKSAYLIGIFSFFLTFSIGKAQIPSGASFWLRADSAVISSGSVISEWKDVSGTTTKSAFQTLPISQPT